MLLKNQINLQITHLFFLFVFIYLFIYFILFIYLFIYLFYFIFFFLIDFPNYKSVFFFLHCKKFIYIN